MSLADFILGRRLATEEQEQQKIGPLPAIPVLGLDALSSAAYGPEAALTVLIPIGAAGLAYATPILTVIIVLLVLVYISYRQTIAAYPGGGGSYTVAGQNLGTLAGLIAGAALAIDYILNVAVGIASGVGALVSALPSLLPHTLALCLLTLLILTIVNLRGVREAGLVFMVPTYLFVGTLGLVVVLGLIRAFESGGHPVPIVAPPLIQPATEAVTAWLIVRAFANGCTAMTGVEAVSNGVPLFRAPATVNAQRTLTAIIFVLVALLAGIAYLAKAYGIAATDPGQTGYQSLLSMLVGAVTGRGLFYYLTIASVVAVLGLSANTSFADFPRLCRVLAEDRFLSDSFAIRGRRLVYSEGIVLLALLSGVLLIAFGGITDRLIPLFAIGALLAFTMSQAGMVWHWHRLGGAGHKLLVNAVGAVATGLTALVVAVSKFGEGAWITVFLVPALVLTFRRINAHYRSVARQISTTAPLDLSSAVAPVVVVATQSWTKLTIRGLQFGMRLSPDVRAVQIKSEAAVSRDLSGDWATLVDAPAQAAHLPAPKLVVLTSTTRQFFTPLVDYVLAQSAAQPNRDIVVIIPDLVVTRWYYAFLHNHRGTILRALLRLRGGPQIVVVNTPFYLRDV